MKHPFYFLLLTFLFSLFSHDVCATHIIGGFMSYEKLSGNTYRLTFKLYRDCFNGQADFDGTPTSSTAVASIGVFEINNTSYTLVTSYSLVNPVVTNISANAGLQNPFVTIPPDVCVEEGVYSYDFTIPDPTKSYILVYERCCRNNSITNLLNPGTQGSTYSVIINPQANNISNSSPQFSVYPPPFICANTFLAYDHSAVDPDGDSLVYSLCNVRSGASQNVPAPNPPNSPPYDTVTWNANYWYNSPMSTDSFEINPTSGLLTCTPTQLGQYLVGICISEYRSGQLISQYTRDFQFNVVGCPTMSNNTNYLPYTFDDNLKYGVYKANDSTLTVDFSGLIFHNPAPTNIPLKILWDFGVSSSNTDTSSLPNPIFTYPDTGSYLATVTITKEILGREMKVIGKGLINLGADSLLSDFSYMQTSGGLQNNINFTDKSFTLNKIVGWRWDFGDGQVSFSQNPSHQFSFTTDYMVYLTTYNNFGKSSKILKYVKVQPLSIDDPLQVNIQISSYSNGISISGINDQSLPAKIFIYNIIGEKILEQKIEQKRDIHFTIPLSQGVYIAKVLNKNGVSKTIKFISK